MKTWLALLVLILTDCVGSICFVQGMRQVGEVKRMHLPELLRLVRRALCNPSLWLGVFNMAISFFMLISLLSWADISFVIPATALTEPLNLLASRYILKEQVSPLRWFSIIFICLGVALISLN